MKKALGIFIFLTLILFTNFVIISAELTAQEEQEGVSLAYACLNEKIDTIDCTRMSVEQSIFSLLATGECLSKVADDSLDSKCWPKSNCDLKTTAQAILALDQVQENTEDAEIWLNAQNMTPKDLDWFLEVDSTEETSCEVTYGGKTFTFDINEDKKIVNTVGGTSCLSVSTSYPYWITINGNCYGETFETTCDEDFLTTLIFKKENEPTIYVLDTTNSQNAGGITLEKINSLCFSKSGIACNYEGSLWAALVLSSKGYNMDPYMPYLVGEAASNAKYSPEAFLYALTNEVDYRTQISENQISNKYWQNYGSNNKYYDTALELLPFQGESGVPEKESSKEWLLNEVQGEDGCWDSGNIVNNAFLLYSIWPEYSGNSGPGATCSAQGYACVPTAGCSSSNIITQYDCGTGNVCCGSGGSGGDEESCETNDFFCVSYSNCEGEILSEFDCDGFDLCCDTEYIEKTCTEWGGEICNSNEYCQSGETVVTSDLTYGESCCLEGICEEVTPVEEFDCEENFGKCEISSCETGYEATNSYSCAYSGDTCCIRSAGPSGSSGGKWWIWILVILIIIVLAAVIFRDKIKEFLIKRKSGKRSPSGMQRGPPGYPPRGPPMRPMGGPPPQRRIMPPQRRPMQQRMPVRPRGEVDDVLKKLKDMSK